MNLVYLIPRLFLLVCSTCLPLVDAFAPTRTVVQETSANRASAFDGSVLGPVARNGLGYEDVVIGTGRRILPGDSVACYYTGSFRKGAFGKPTVFDSIGAFCGHLFCGSFSDHVSA